ncbi:unnamed protein product [Rotaria socialis]|uniref:MULE transposase domain-containing protein n=1 Tax=Rotaria socialis TaxID=392032 RepID=A0A820H023_9BILA|nr:unnamed protein product [Rotaria socialis]CAF4360091.1 unnamed protein product [Rotaria socialis]CAF4868605.1 unnamed protein product [Rotaria socialis]
MISIQKTILSDFEAATRKSINSLFPNILHKDCLFHFGQCTWRQIQSLELQMKYQEDVIKAFNVITDDFRGSGRKKPLFPIEIWNVYDRTVVNLPRSNNSIKGWHNAFTKRVAIVHSTITKLTEKIRREQSKFEVDIAQIRQGQEPKPKKLKYRKLDERIKRLVDDYGNVDLGAYLKRLANQHVCDELPVQHIFLATNCLQRIALRRIVQLPIEDDDPFSSVQLQFQ